MRVTSRDVTLVRDLALSHLMSRNQIMALGYFGSVTRTNTRLRELIGQSLVRRLESPFFGQGLYAAGRLAPEIVGDRVAPLLESRTGSPRFVRHALALTDVRIALRKRSSGEWRFEQQLWRTLEGQPRREVRPDGLLMGKLPIFVEVDMGQASLPKFREKLLAYRALARSGQCQGLYGFDRFRLLTVTTGELRSRHLRRQMPPDPGFELLVQTFEDLGVAPTESWS